MSISCWAGAPVLGWAGAPGFGPCVWTPGFGPLCLDPCVWTPVFGPCVWTPGFGPLCLDPVFGPLCLDPCVTPVFGPLCLGPCVWALCLDPGFWPLGLDPWVWAVPSMVVHGTRIWILYPGWDSNLDQLVVPLCGRQAVHKYEDVVLVNVILLWRWVGHCTASGSLGRIVSGTCVEYNNWIFSTIFFVPMFCFLFQKNCPREYPFLLYFCFLPRGLW